MKSSIAKYRAYSNSELMQSIKSFSSSSSGENEQLELAIQKVELARRAKPPEMTLRQIWFGSLLMAVFINVVIAFATNYFNNVQAADFYSRIGLVLGITYAIFVIVGYLYKTYWDRATKAQRDANHTLVVNYDMERALAVNSNEAQLLIKNRKQFELLDFAEIQRVLGIFGYNLHGVKVDTSTNGQMKTSMFAVLVVLLVGVTLYVKFFM